MDYIGKTALPSRKDRLLYKIPTIIAFFHLPKVGKNRIYNRKAFLTDILHESLPFLAYTEWECL
jgi:hypothetical protein